MDMVVVMHVIVGFGFFQTAAVGFSERAVSCDVFAVGVVCGADVFQDWTRSHSSQKLWILNLCVYPWKLVHLRGKVLIVTFNVQRRRQNCPECREFA